MKGIDISAIIMVAGAVAQLALLRANMVLSIRLKVLLASGLPAHNALPSYRAMVLDPRVWRDKRYVQKRV